MLLIRFLILIMSVRGLITPPLTLNPSSEFETFTTGCFTIYKINADELKFDYCLNMPTATMATNEVVKRKADHNTIALMTAAYVSSGEYPVGLSIYKGRVINKHIANLEGIVTLYPNGKLSVSSLYTDSIITSPMLQGKVDAGEYFTRMNRFQQQATAQKLTIFQTHLLVHNNILKIDKQKFLEAKDRRFFVSGLDSESGLAVYCIINVTKFCDKDFLKVVKKAILLLQSCGVAKINYMINLDTGVNDYFWVDNSHSKSSLDPDTEKRNLIPSNLLILNRSKH